MTSGMACLTGETPKKFGRNPPRHSPRSWGLRFIAETGPVFVWSLVGAQ